MPRLGYEPHDFVSGTALAARTGNVFLFALCLAIAFVSLACPPVYGDVGIVLNESLDTSVDRITGTGHSAVYFSRICPESPVKLRLCRPGETGSVMSNYINIGEDRPFEWNVVPLNVYLYGVEDARHRPLFGSYKIKHLLEQRYLAKYLSGYCERPSCTTGDKAEWRELVAVTLIRSFYIFVIDTTVEQDREFIAEFNALPNQNHFNGVTRNCADFTRRIINSYFPHAANPDYINDFGMTSPKAVARSFTHYALRHPETNFRVLHFAQVPGTIKRSTECRAGTEQLYHSKKFLVPMIVFADYGLPVAAASYILTGRFNPVHEFEGHPATEKGPAHAKQPEKIAPGERAQFVGTSDEWKEYRRALDSIVKESVHARIIRDRGYLNHLFRHFDEAGTPLVDEDGDLWMEISQNGETFKVGLSAHNILAQGSDSQLAYELLLARTNSFLKSPKHSRETMSEFKQDWSLLQHASRQSVVSVAVNFMPGKSIPSTNKSGAGDD